MVANPPPRRRRLALDVLGSSILVALVLTGLLMVASAEGPGELGLGVALGCASFLLLAKEIRFAIQTWRSTQEGESDD